MVRRVFATFDTVTVGGLHQPLRSGERSFVQALGHLVNCEARSSEAIYLALLLEAPLLANVHPERQFGKLIRFDQLSSADLLHSDDLDQVGC